MMRVEFNRTGAERKALVTAISEILGTKAKYMGMPSTAYDFGGLIVDKTGALDFGNGCNQCLSFRSGSVKFYSHHEYLLYFSVLY